MEPVFYDTAQMENYHHESYSTYGDQMQYSYEYPQYSTAQPYAQSEYDYYQYQSAADQLAYSEGSEQNAVILLATDQPSESTYQSMSNAIPFDGEGNTSAMSFRTEAELLDYLNSFGDLGNIQIMPIVGDLENIDKYIDQISGQQVPKEPAELPTIVSEEPAPVLPAQSEEVIPQKRSPKPHPKDTKPPKIRLVYENSSFVCEPCERTFGRRSGLIQHNNVHHSGPREHRCDTCGKRFHTGDDLRRHVQRHLSQHKPHKCAKCPRQFNYQQDLERHKAVKHGVAKYACQHCGKRIGRRDHLLSHEATHARWLGQERRRNRFQELGAQQQ